jgi:hypothetical protein
MVKGSSGDKLKAVGGIKGAIQRGGSWCLETAWVVREKGMVCLKWGVRVGGSLSFALATTSMVVLMPLLFEIAREGQVRSMWTGTQQTPALSRLAHERPLRVCRFGRNSIAATLLCSLMLSIYSTTTQLSDHKLLETERAQIKDLKSKGYSDRQLQELGFSENALHSPSVASLKA